ncbi:hypothetical protein Psuf_058560 [Phytohabitans suffuscus]|uniref:SMP-30/Gluconolactonase/LRE-like region domain-containing protein n=1 Tax=Phytohabitans suffuscus TaxID=624315 RepID=A0A6F8YRC6_9ACTN|nr:hypothetical protein [Phytohabitans suffuscus]BCB88543.1 hypothetical protein Psuf_058560 [Phytohabitans suffuscus]
MVLRAPTVVQLRDYASMDVLREFPALGESPSGLTYAAGVVVYGDFDDGVLRAMDPRTGEHLGQSAVPGHPTGITWDGERLWYCDFPARSFRALTLSCLLTPEPAPARGGPAPNPGGLELSGVKIMPQRYRRHVIRPP